MAAVGSVLGVMGLPLVKDFNTTFTQVSLLTGFQLCTVGAIAVFISAASQKYGRCPLFVTSTAILVVGSLWCAAAQSYGSMVGARVLQGVGAATFENVTFAVVGDLYCVHQRGARMAIATLAQSRLLPLPSLIAGKVAEDLGWRWVFWILSIFLGTAFIGIALFGWESAYNRTDAHDRPASPDDGSVRLTRSSQATNYVRTLLKE
ncbi:hypothetical protein SLS56_011715 [Neofusicoccum ribis]|uniref:Major facilitator superfamily (MFS) profile domain-containing protein n=1 Tax=Neofusicoccum ribis TaxID=45134 RepID=A0ABR3SAW3_9PEZI